LKVLIVPVQFSDFSNTTSIESNIVSQKLLPLISYYSEVSYGLLSLDVQHLDSWFTLPHTRAYYGSDDGSEIDLNVDRFVTDSLDIADPYANYRDYECVMLVHAGNDQAKTHDSLDLWSQASTGKRRFGNDGGVNLGFTVVAENDPYGVFAHELGHNIKLPDLYDSDQKKEFVGDWSLMASGSWTAPPTSLMAAEKMWLGWIPVSNMTIVNAGETSNATISKLEAPDHTLAAKIPVGSAYYVVEYRKKVLSDRAIPMQGVIVSYVDEGLESGHGIVKVRDAEPTSETLDDAAFTSGMRFVDMQNEVAVKVWSLDSESATVMVQKGFADLLLNNIQFVGEAVDGKNMLFDVYIENSGVTPSNSAWVSLRINGSEFQRKALSSANPGSTTVVEFGPWQTKLGLNKIEVFVDANNDVVEKNKTNNIMSADLNVHPRYISIDRAEVSEQRADINSTQQVYFHAKWSNNGSDVFDGMMYVNGSAYAINSTGWIRLATTSSAIGNLSWLVTGVDVDGVWSFLQEVPNPYIVWDMLEVYDSGVSRERCDVGSTQTVWVKVRYAYDGRVFDNLTGVLWIGGKVAEWNVEVGCWSVSDSRDSVGEGDYVVPSNLEDRLYGLRFLFGRRNMSIIWDSVSFTVSVRDHRVDVGSTVRVEVDGTYEYDSTVWDGTVKFNDTLMKNEVGMFFFAVASIKDPRFGLTVFTSNVNFVIFDRVLVHLSVPVGRISVGQEAALAVSGVYGYDGSVWDGAFTLNDTLAKGEVGEFGFTVISISDPKYDLTVFESNSVSAVWDRVNITLSAADERVSVGSKALINWGGVYEYDGEGFHGNAALNDDVVKNSVGLVHYRVENVSDPLHNLTAFTSNVVDVIFDQVVCEIKVDALMPGRVRLEISAAYQFDGSPVNDANVTVGDMQAEIMGYGKYLVTLSEWRPYAIYHVTVERRTFAKELDVSSIPVGNVSITVLAAIIVLVFAVFFKRNRRRGWQETELRP
jgi:M6 family metalloprotease-like protein